MLRCCGVCVLWWCSGAASAVLEMEISAKDVMSERFVALSEEEMLSKAITVFEERSPEAIVVFDSNGTYKGVLSERWIYRARIDPRRTKVKSLTRGVPAVSEDTNIVEVARKMLESGVQAVPVFKASASLSVSIGVSSKQNSGKVSWHRQRHSPALCGCGENAFWQRGSEEVCNYESYLPAPEGQRRKSPRNFP
ncbi:MAG: CBS-domain-containing membrane protein [Methanophagales archaeon]|nr:CBS domain-containing protein [Methanophagales archaeon]MCU4140783.1 CBS-domain-containing membrane protein [Methanophagales archaeon]